jgi:hypothetical protein
MREIQNMPPVTFAVCPSMGRDCLTGMLESLINQVDRFFLVRTEKYVNPIDHPRLVSIESVGHLVDPVAEPKNIQHWWNLGIIAAEAQAQMLGLEEWNVLVVNDDIVAPPHLVRTLGRAMRETTAVLAYPNAFDDRCVMNTEPGPVDLRTRITGWCWMIRGESGITADERFQWWYGDDDLDWTARTMGGALCVPGCAVEHLYPGQTTGASPELTARTHLDRQEFAAKWQGVPH